MRPAMGLRRLIDSKGANPAMTREALPTRVTPGVHPVASVPLPLPLVCAPAVTGRFAPPPWDRQFPDRFTGKALPVGFEPAVRSGRWRVFFPRLMALLLLPVSTAGLLCG